MNSSQLEHMATDFYQLAYVEHREHRNKVRLSTRDASRSRVRQPQRIQYGAEVVEVCETVRQFC